MKKNRISKHLFLITLSVAALLITAGYMKGTCDGRVGNDFSLMKEAITAQHSSEVSPVRARGGRIAYDPNNEDLAPDEMRIISLGTGMPNPRPSQKATCWLVELGNGDTDPLD